jgi:2-iminobutanoate/2-iminopropanoate deaminase
MTASNARPYVLASTPKTETKMTSRTRIDDPAAAPNTGSYSPALRFGPFIAVSGQGPIDPSGAVVPGDIRAQTALTLDNVRRLVEAAGGRMDQVVRCTCFLADISDFDAFDEVYRTYFRDPLPTRTTVAAGLDGILVEIDALVWIGP